MIEITHTTGRQEDKTKVKNKKKLTSVGSSKKSFSSELQGTITEDFEGSIDELLFDLKDQEKRFLDSPSDLEMARYKALVKKILKTIIDEGLRTATLKRNPGDRKVYTVVQEIDKKFLELAEAVTKKSNAFTLMRSIEEIRGLLLDLLS